MNILFVYDAMHSIGGVQTLLARLIRELDRRGHAITLVTTAPRHGAEGELLTTISRHARVHYASLRFFLPLQIGMPRGFDTPAFDVIHCCNLPSLIYGLSLREHLKLESPVSVGVYHPREYCWEGDMSATVFGRISQQILAQFPDENLLFLSENMARHVRDCSGRDLDKAPIVPIGIDLPEQWRSSPPSPPYRLVSVTRTEPYYPIHRHMVDVCRELRKRGYPVEYHGYGAGSTLENLKRYAQKAVDGSGSGAVFHGAIPMSQLRSILDGAYAYVGLGTSLLEAAAAGVPSVVAVDGAEDPVSYGWLHEVEDSNLGGFTPGRSTRAISELLLELLEGHSGDYEKVARESRRRSSDFSSQRSATEFERAVGSLKPVDFSLEAQTRVAATVESVSLAGARRLGLSDPRARRYVRPSEASSSP